MISAIIITKNEENMLPDCLKSLAWVDEIVVIDTGSIDKTNAIAVRFNARIVKYRGKPNFARWRNLGMQEAKGDWILYIDADERITPALKEEILRSIMEMDFDAYAIPRRNFIFGKELKHCGLYPDYVKRLFKKSAFKLWTGELHEEPSYLFNGKLTHGHNETIGHIKNPLLHIKHETLSEMVAKTNDWSEIEARLMFRAHHPPMTISRFLSAAFREFWLRMFKQMAFLDGGEGIIYGMYQVFSRFVSYAKLWELQLNASRNP